MIIATMYRPNRASHVGGSRRSCGHTSLLLSCPDSVLANVVNMDPKLNVLPPPATPPRRPPKRSNQLVGVHFESPKRRRPMRKDSAIVVRPGFARREQELTSRLDALLGKQKGPINDEHQPADFIDDPTDVLNGGEDAQEPAQAAVPESLVDSIPISPPHGQQASPRRSLPKKAAQRLYDNWLALIPTLEDQYLSYMQRAQGRLGRQLDGEPYHCTSRRCVTRTSTVQCLYADCTFLSILSNFVWPNHSKF